VNKCDLDKALTNVVKTDQLKHIVTNIVTEIIGKCKEEFENKLKERTEKLQDNLDYLLIENEQLRETIHTQDRKLRDMELTMGDNGHRANLALKLANYN